MKNAFFQNLNLDDVEFRKRYETLFEFPQELIERYDMEDEVGYLIEVDLVNIISYKIQYFVSFLLLLLYSSIFDNKKSI